MWGGCFADHGVLSGNGGFEVKFVEALEFTDDDPALLNSDPKPVSDKTTGSSEPNKTGEDNTENPAKESDVASDEVEEISSVSKTESSICRFGWTVQETVKRHWRHFYDDRYIPGRVHDWSYSAILSVNLVYK